MTEPNLTPLFRAQDVQQIADFLSRPDAKLLHSAEFQRVQDDLHRNRITGEANTREKIIEPILYEVLGYDRNENDAEHAVKHASARGETGAVEYFFRIKGNNVPIEAKTWKKLLDKRDASGRSPVQQGLAYAVHTSSRWFIVTNGCEWRLFKTQLKGSQSPLTACEQYFLKDVIENRRTFLRFYATFGRDAFVTNGEGISRLDELRRQSEGWQLAIGESLFAKLVDYRTRLFREVQPQFSGVPQEDINDAVVKLLFRIMFILFAEHTPLLPKEFLLGEIIGRFEADQQWKADNGSLYGYIQRYFQWLDGRETNKFSIYPYDGALFDVDPILDGSDVRIGDDLLKNMLVKLSKEGLGRSIDYSQINPRILGNIYEQFLGYVIEIKEGRLDPRADRDTRRKEGSFYTPESVTKFLVEHCVEQALAENPGRKPWELRCLDPACGSGHFLVEYVNHVAERSEREDDGRSFSQWKRYITEHCVFGVDKDRTAVMLTKLSLWINSAMKDEPFATIDTHIKCGNSLVCGTPAGFRLDKTKNRSYAKHYRQLTKLRKELTQLENRSEEERTLFSVTEASEFHREIRSALAQIEDAKEPITNALSQKLQNKWPCLQNTTCFNWEVEFAEVFEEHDGFDVIVGNPPWGADLADIGGFLEGGAFELAQGQYDSYELFIELGRRLQARKGVFGFIVPDSITSPGDERLRRMLLDSTSLTRLVRTGEGLFSGVYRSAFLLAFVNAPAGSDWHVRVGTLRKADRRLLEEDTLFERMKTVSEVLAEHGHDVAQSHFAGNPRCEFDILAKDFDAPIVKLIDDSPIDWSALTIKGRGVEIGKSGDVLQCPFCHKWDNVPRKSKGKWQSKTCRHCKRQFDFEDAARYDTIIAEKPRRTGWKRIIPGEAVNRYALGPVQYIDPTKDGINYKAAEFYQGKRILVRQTGVGIYATIDDSGMLTNQSVFTWKLRDVLAPALSKYRLEYILGVLNSLTMLYRYYMKSGDTEWRSFPRWTQELVQEMPVRAIDFANRREKGLHDRIADRVASVLAKSTAPTDHEFYQIEKLVMQLYGITRPMCRRIFDVLHEVQRLRVIREMNIAKPDMLLDALPE